MLLIGSPYYHVLLRMQLKHHEGIAANLTTDGCGLQME